MSEVFRGEMIKLDQVPEFSTGRPPCGEGRRWVNDLGDVDDLETMTTHAPRPFGPWWWRRRWACVTRGKLAWRCDSGGFDPYGAWPGAPAAKMTLNEWQRRRRERRAAGQATLETWARARRRDALAYHGRIAWECERRRSTESLCTVDSVRPGTHGIGRYTCR